MISSKNFLPVTHRPFENDGSLIDGFIVGDVGSINRAFMGSPTHHCVCLRRSTGRTGTDYIHSHNTKLIGRTYRERGKPLLICLWGLQAA